ncbi:tetraacyldisaccharide 4'-kinase [Ectothiorhodospiraceae bacterium 2226]|nr:tetraacyldisaccharide 4'-kinase [Ectothiorhodospiraceae bacterium 2226]
MVKGAPAWWYTPHPLGLLLRPLGWLYCALAQLRAALYRAGLRARTRLPVPVIVVGNISVGGTGKTPLVIWLAHWLQAQGYRPGIVSRGYGGAAGSWPQQVRPDSDPTMVGDEPVLIAQRTGCPMAVGPDRVAAARALLEYHNCDILVSDDGLQHYRLGRDIEIAVLDGVRRLGNGQCLPAGPLREPPARLQRVDCVVVNGTAGAGEYAMQLQPAAARHLQDDARTFPLTELNGQAVDAVAGIGHPARFFDLLRRLGAQPREHAFPDHHRYRADDLVLAGPVIMTEKDAVKCRRYAREDHWYLPVEARLDAAFEARLSALLKELARG